MTWILRLTAALSMVVAFAACSSSGAGGREVVIVQTDDGCTPARITAAPDEKLKLVVRNDSGSDYEVEGIEGTRLEEVLIPKGKTRTPGYRVPDAGSGTYKIKCYVPGGPTTVIEVVVGGGAPAGGGATAEPDPEGESEPTSAITATP